jgi:hypothetical protein
MIIAGNALTAANMYAYCNNNPVGLVYSAGRMAEWNQGDKGVVDVAQAVLDAVEQALDALVTGTGMTFDDSIHVWLPDETNKLADPWGKPPIEPQASSASLAIPMSFWGAFFYYLCRFVLENVFGVYLRSAIYYIRNACYQEYLTANGSSTGSAVTKSAFTGAKSQQWKITDRGNGRFSLVPQNATGCSLTMDENTDNKPIARIREPDSVNENKQRWKITKSNGGAYVIQPAISTTRVLEPDAVNPPNVVLFGKTEAIQQDWVLEPVTTGVGAAWNYAEISQTDYDHINCFMYALNMTPQDLSEPGKTGLSGDYGASALEVMTQRVLDYARVRGKRIEVIQSATTPIPSDRYRFCMRIRIFPHCNDYHFMLESKDKGWAEKHGWQKKSNVVGFIDPATNELAWHSNVAQDYYNLGTVFFAVTL